MAYRYDTQRDEAYMDGPLSGASTSLLRIAGEYPILPRVKVQSTDSIQEDGGISGELSEIRSEGQFDTEQDDTAVQASSEISIRLAVFTPAHLVLACSVLLSLVLQVP